MYDIHEFIFSGILVFSFSLTRAYNKKVISIAHDSNHQEEKSED